MVFIRFIRGTRNYISFCVSSVAKLQVKDGHNKSFDSQGLTTIVKTWFTLMIYLWFTFALKNTDSCKGYWGFPYSSESSPSIFRSPTSSSSLLRFIPVWKPEAEKDTTQVVSPLSPIIHIQILQTDWLLTACWSLHLFNIKNDLNFPSSHQE